MPAGNHVGDDDNLPKAFVTILLFDNNYNLLDATWDQIDSDGAQTSPTLKQPPHDLMSATYKVKEAGFAYVFVSNEHATFVDIYFDDLTVTHMPSPIMSVADYYPYGLTFKSSQRENTPQNRYLYNDGAERQDALDLHVDATKFRTYDPALGRWWQVDPLADQDVLVSVTPYNYSFDNPVRYNDPLGDCPTCLIGFLIGAGVEYGMQVAGNYLQGKTGVEAWTDVDPGDILISGGAGALTGGLSAIGGKGTQLAISTSIDAAESVAKQVNEGQGVTLAKTVTDVVGEKIGGTLTKKLDKIVDTKVTTKQLDRATRVSKGDPSSSGRKEAVTKLEKQLNVKNAVNQVAGQASQQSTGDIAQYSLDNTINNATSADFDSPTVQQDATRVAPVVRLPLKTTQ